MVRPACRKIEARVPRLIVPCSGTTATLPVGVAIDGVASLDPHAPEARGPGARHVADRKVRRRRAHAAGSANEVTSGVLET